MNGTEIAVRCANCNEVAFVTTNPALAATRVTKCAACTPLALQEWFGPELVVVDREPLLGLATTQQLVEEVAARVHVAASIGETWPNYRTVDS